MEGNNNLSNLSFLQGTVSNEELDPRILATFYTTFKIGKIALLAVVEVKFVMPHSFVSMRSPVTTLGKSL